MMARLLAAPAFAGRIALLCALATAAPVLAGNTASHDKRTVAGAPLLGESEFTPTHLFAPPPAPNSALEAAELARLRALRRAASPERLARAARDGHDKHPDAFNDAAGRDLTKLPATMALLTRMQSEAARIVKAGKRHFKRLRPYVVDPALAHCSNSNGRDDSYPSGHAGFAWSVGWALARLIPERAPQILARAQDYALGREICGVHFPSDIEASHAAGVLIADRLLNDPRLAPQVAAARRELARP